MSKTYAIILSGCGFLDGAEIRESVLTLLALDTEGIAYKFFAPNKDQHHVVNHLNAQEVTGTSRNVLEESARIARGDISDIKELDVNNFDGIVIPGGFGVAKNFCSFAFKGPEADVDESIVSVMREFHANKKPIGAICIAPALVALTFGSKNPTLTIGDDTATAQAVESLGAKHENCPVTSFVVDASNKIVTTPAYMYGDAKVHEVYQGIHALVKKMVELS